MKPLLKSRYYPLLVVALAVALGAVAIGCTELDNKEGTDGLNETTTFGLLPADTTTEVGASSTDTLGPTTTVAPGTTTALTQASTPTTEKLASSERRLPNGNIKACGMIMEVWMQGGVRKLNINYADYLTGAAADAAAIEDGVLDPGDGHMGVYIRDHSAKLRIYTVSNSVAITTWWAAVQWPHPSPTVPAPPCSWTDFYNYWHQTASLTPEEVARAGGLSSSYWWIERDGTVIVKIEQVH
jgi:hypothetical protein